MFPGNDIENNFHNRIKTLNALLIKIFPGFKSHLINTQSEHYIFFQQVHHPAIIVGSSQPDLLPLFLMLLV